MAVNKRKVLDAARKYAQKGAKEKALKEYHTLLKLDPRDAKLHLEIGDCYRRWGQIDEAITQYARVADQYKDDGFDARSVAVFKQILNLDPKRYSAYVSLAELYQRMGLDSEALGALQAAADGYHKEGDKPAALELLRKMATLDPTNTTSRLKVAELLRQEGMEDDAVAEYEAVIAELDRQGAREQTLPVLERILELRPDRSDILRSTARKLIEIRKPERAEPFARKAVELDAEDADALEVAIDVYKALGKDEELASTTRALAKMYRERGDQDKARELAQRIPLSMELAADEEGGEAPEESESAFLSDDELLDDDFLAGEASETAEPELPLEEAAELELELDDEADEEDDAEELVLDQEDDGALDTGDAAADEGEAPLPEGDPEQLLAEASVYLRYGKRDQAIASLQAVLAQEPDHRAALERLGDAYAEGGDDVPAVAVWTRAAERAAADGDSSAFELLRDRIAALDEAAAAGLEAPSPSEAVDSIDDGDAASLDLDDDDLEIDVSVGDEASGEDPPPAEDEDVDEEIEIDFSDDDEGDAEDGVGAGDLEIEAAPEDSETADDDFEIDVDIDGDDEEDEAQEAAGEGPAADAGGDGASSTASQQVAEDLEEAEFYFQQELFDEAEAIYRRILKIAPNHPSALLRLGELAAKKGGDPAEAGHEPAAPEVEAAAANPEAELDDVEFEIDVDDEPQDDEAEDEADADEIEFDEEGETEDAFDDELDAGAVADDSTEVAELSLDGDEMDEPAVQIDVPPGPTPEPPAHAEDTQPLESEAETAAEDDEPEAALADVDEAPAEPEPDEVVEVADDDEEEGGGFDLAAELRDVIEEDEDPNAETGSGLSTVEDGFESVFADFKQGVSATLSEDDFETRYDLGIAYREMELYDDAIGEFRMCLDSPSWKLASLHMMGLCALDLGRAQDAANHLEQALATPDLPDEQIAGLQFDLGRALEVSGDLDRARSAYESALAADPDLPGVQERIDALGSGAVDAGADTEDDDAGFESFDDLVAEAQGEEIVEAAEEAESFESFDDVITEAEAEVDVEPEPIETAEPVAEPEPAPKKKKRKKKISFV